MGIGIQGVHHIGISVPDLALARRFFIDLLGGVEEVAPMSWRNNPYIDAIVELEDSAADLFMCRLGNTHIEVFKYHAPLPAAQEPNRGVHNLGYTHFALQVDDIVACHEKLSAAGIRFHVPPDVSTITIHPDGSKTGYCATYCRDFFGNAFEIMEIHDTDEIKRV